jgi:hypothetical protein
MARRRSPWWSWPVALLALSLLAWLGVGCFRAHGRFCSGADQLNWLVGL